MIFYRDLSEPGKNIYISRKSIIPMDLEDQDAGRYLCPDCSTPRIDGDLVTTGGKLTIQVKRFWHDHHCPDLNHLVPIYRRCPFPEGFVVPKRT